MTKEKTNKEEALEEKLVVKPEDGETPGSERPGSKETEPEEPAGSAELSAAAETDEKTDETAAATEDLDEIPEKPGTGRILKILLIIGFVLSFALPYSYTNHQASKLHFEFPNRKQFTAAPDRKVEDARNEAIRSGLVGIMVALAIFAIWQLDKMTGKGSGRIDMNDRKVAVIVACLACLLWLVWTCSGHIMLRVNDEVYDVPPQLPGLDRDGD